MIFFYNAGAKKTFISFFWEHFYKLIKLSFQCKLNLRINIKYHCKNQSFSYQWLIQLLTRKTPVILNTF